MTDTVLIKFIDEEGIQMTDIMQVPIDITDDSLRQIIKKDNILYIDGNVLTGSIKNSLNGDVDFESVFLIRVANRKPTAPATFCSSSYSGHEGPVLKCKIINKQLAVTVGDDKTVRFWDLITKTQFMINKAHDHWVLHCEKYKNFVVTAGMDSKICVFDFKGNLIDQIKKQRLGISSFVVKNDLIFSGARDGSVIVLSYVRECFKVIAEFGSCNSITAMCVNDRHIMFGDSKGKICVYYLKTYKKVCELKGYSSKINVMVNNAKYLISGDDDGNVIVFNLNDFSICYRLKHKREVISISISPDELSFATGGFDKTVQLWNLSKGLNLGKYFHVGPVYKIMYYDDLIISCSKDKMIRMFKVSKNKVISDLSVDDEIYDFDYSFNLLITGLKNSKVNFFY